MDSVEKLGFFYLGKNVDPKTGKLGKEPTLYDSKDLTTHAVCVGMTGSGKTGLGITLLEEAALDKIPAIIIDPKGDLGDLLLTFPNLSAQEFKPWVDSAEAERKGMDDTQYAEFLAKTWKDGLATWDEKPERISKLKQSVEMTIYTPASDKGVGLSIVNSFAAPPAEQQKDADSMRDKVQSITSSLLGLIGITADPIKSREHILISTIIDQAWKNNADLDIATLIQQIQKPTFSKIGAMDVNTFYPQKDRMELSIKLNNLLASPGFQAWMQGEPLDIQRLLHTPEGKPKLSIISIAHLSDSERMFFVTLLLNEFITWMRQQPGTSSLRAILYMDEIFGYFPPTAMPPSKLPMLTLLKQARAYGIGIVLVTQNPVDLDYKGLANCGTWFIGKLQTQRDKMRVIEGLQIASNGEVDSSSLDKMIAMIGNRTFIMRSIYKKEPILFQTRWTLSYLKGPLTLTQIATLTDKSEQPPSVGPVKQIQTKPNIAPGITEYFAKPTTTNEQIHYLPKVLGKAKLHFVDSKNALDVWEAITFILPSLDDGKTVNWSDGINIPDVKFDTAPASNSTFEEIPSGLAQEKNYAALAKSLALCLYQNETYKIYKAKDFNITSKSGETEGDFRARVVLSIREKRDELIKKVRDKYSSKLNTITEKMKRAEGKAGDKQQKSFINKIQAAISFIMTLLGALMGRGKITQTTISRAGTSLRRAGQISKDSQDASQAQESYENLQQQQAEIQKQMDSEIDAIGINVDPQSINVETISIPPRKSDISVEQIALIWCPK